MLQRLRRRRVQVDGEGQMVLHSLGPRCCFQQQQEALVALVGLEDEVGHQDLEDLEDLQV